MAMHLSDLKRQPVAELMETAREMGLENVGRSRKQEVIAAIVRKQSKNGEDIYGEGTLEILQDGFGFLRSPDSSYLAGLDGSIYVPGIVLLEKFGRLKTAKDILRCSKSTKLTSVKVAAKRTKSYSKI